MTSTRSAIAGWSGGFGEPAYDAARSAERDKWTAYADMLTGGIEVALDLRRRADHRAEQGRGRDREVAAGRGRDEAGGLRLQRRGRPYNSYVNRQVCVPSYGGGSVRRRWDPGRPGPFVDPGRGAARRGAADPRGRPHRARLGRGSRASRSSVGSPGAKTESSSPALAPPARRRVRASTGATGRTPSARTPSRARTASTTTGSRTARSRSTSARSRARRTPVRRRGFGRGLLGRRQGHADGTFTFARRGGGASGKIDANGAGRSGARRGHHRRRGGLGRRRVGHRRGRGKGEASVGASAEGEVAIGPHGRARGRRGLRRRARWRPAVGRRRRRRRRGEAEGWAGIGASGDVDFGFHDGKFEIGGSGGVALGVGGKLSGHITIDPGEVIETGWRHHRGDRGVPVMTTTLPVPVRFALPNESGSPVQPESLGVSNAAFLAVRRGLPGDYDPTLTMSGDWRTTARAWSEIADESVEKLRLEGATEVELLKRKVIESEHAPAVTQSIGAVIATNGRTYDLRQAQVGPGSGRREGPGPAGRGDLHADLHLRAVGADGAGVPGVHGQRRGRARAPGRVERSRSALGLSRRSRSARRSAAATRTTTRRRRRRHRRTARSSRHRPGAA